MPDREEYIKVLSKAVKTVKEFNEDAPIKISLECAEDILSLLKEKEEKNGEWITIWREDDPDTSTNARCSICNMISERPVGKYCKWCGAKMSQERGEYVSVPFSWLVKFCSHIDFVEPLTDAEREVAWRQKLEQQFGINVP